MKQIKLWATVFMMSLTVGAGAQITLTSETSVPRVGDIFRYHGISTPGDLDVLHGGANQEWDMSSVAEGLVSPVTYISVENSTDPDALSNLVGAVEQGGVTGETYYTASSAGLTVNKILVPSVSDASYTNRYFVKLPLAYDQEYNELFTGTITNIEAGQTFLIEGTSKIEADGYGTLKLPSGTINNVLRVKVTYEYTYSMDFGGGMLFPIMELQDIVYLWYNANTRTYLANYSVSYADTGTGMQQISRTLQYLASSDIAASQTNVTADKFSLYPNPTQGVVNITGVNDTPDVKVYNLNGVLLQEKRSSVIDFSNYSSGLYLIDIAGEKMKVIKK